MITLGNDQDLWSLTFDDFNFLANVRYCSKGPFPNLITFVI